MSLCIIIIIIIIAVLCVFSLNYGFNVSVVPLCPSVSLSSVLLFPPLPSRLRYLIHNYTEDVPELTTFSVGDSWCRRVVVCHSDLCEEPLARSKRREGIEGDAKPKSSNVSRSRGPKRPDKPLYMPRAARERLSLQNSQGPSGDQELPSPASSSYSCISSSSESCSYPETTENTKSSSTSGQESDPSVVDGVLNHVAESPALCPEGLMLHEAESLVWDETVSCFAEMTLEEDEKDKEDLASVACSDVTEEVSLHLALMVWFF
uniref:R3H domain-containing protein n=1 Tax=Dicentrarchus labrax TaxID=13489 RepID=A0A8C4GFG6_DICLA